VEPRSGTGSQEELIVRRFLSVVGLALTLAGSVAAPAMAQGLEGFDPAFSDTILSQMGYTQLDINVGPDGVVAPSTLEAGYYHVTLTVDEPSSVGYVDIVQPPAGLDAATELAEMMDAGSNDLVHEGWVFNGGTNTPNPGETASFVINLAPGDYKIAASYYGLQDGSEEVMKLMPLTVTESTATDEVAEPVAGATLEMTDDLTYVVSPEPVPAGPQVWKIANIGSHHAHHMVMVSIPEGITADQIVSEFSSMMQGTPTAEPPLMAQFSWVAYAALQSGGQTTWAEFDLKPGTYAVICYIMDPMTELPHVVSGMVTTFTVA
jgi:hypothetical protein